VAHPAAVRFRYDGGVSPSTIAVRSEPLVTLRRVICCANASGPSVIEHSERDALVLPVRGFFVKHLSPSTVFVTDPATAAFFAAGRPHRISHPADGGDECIALEVDPSTWRAALIDNASTEDVRDLEPFAVLSARAIAERALIASTLTDAPAGAAIEIEETALHLLAFAARGARRRAAKRAPVRAATLSKQSEQVNATRATLAAHPVRSWTLAETSRSVNSSPYELARMFRQATGSSIHQYLVRLRIAAATHLLLDTRMDLATIALECGFCSHSHFTTSFARLVGVTPSAFRKSRTNVKAL